MVSFRFLLMWLVIGVCSQSQPQLHDEFAGGTKWLEEETVLQMLNVRRVYVDRFSGGETATQIRDMIISSLQAVKLFVLTENEERADAILRGSAEDLVFTDAFYSQDGLSARASLGIGTDPDKLSTDRRSRNAGVTVGENEATRKTDRKHEATVSVRLVSKNGDVLWSTTQESLGGKFKGASADVAEKVARQLLGDYGQARRLRHLQEK